MNGLGGLMGYEWFIQWENGDNHGDKSTRTFLGHGPQVIIQLAGFLGTPW